MHDLKISNYDKDYNLLPVPVFQNPPRKVKDDSEIELLKSSIEKIEETLRPATTMQKDLKVPKGNFNSFGKYKYRSCEDIIEAVKSILDYGNTITLSDEVVMLGDRFYIKATATLTAGEQSIYKVIYQISYKTH